MDYIDDVRRAKKGDKEAFIRIVRHAETSLYQAARAILQTDSDCADAIQETILKSYTSIRSLKEPLYFKTWMYRILINECRKILKLKQKVVYFQPSQESSELDQGYSRLELTDAIGMLEESLRVVIHLYYYCDLRISDIAKTLDIPEGTVKSRLYRARELLYTQLKWDTKGVDLQ